MLATLANREVTMTHAAGLRIHELLRRLAADQAPHSGLGVTQN